MSRHCGLSHSFWYFRIVFDNLAVDYVIWTAQKPFAMQFYYHIRQVSMFVYVLTAHVCVSARVYQYVCVTTNVYLCNVYCYWMLSIPFLWRWKMSIIIICSDRHNQSGSSSAMHSYQIHGASFICQQFTKYCGNLSSHSVLWWWWCCIHSVGVCYWITGENNHWYILTTNNAALL